MTIMIHTSEGLEKKINKAIDGLDYKIAFEEKAPTSNQVGFLLDLMTDYNVMIECMINYAHWIVLLGYIHLGNIE